MKNTPWRSDKLGASSRDQRLAQRFAERGRKHKRPAESSPADDKPDEPPETVTTTVITTEQVTYTWIGVDSCTIAWQPVSEPEPKPKPARKKKSLNRRMRRASARKLARLRALIHRIENDSLGWLLETREG